MKKIFLFAASLFLVMSTGCSDLLDVSPRQSIDSATALTTEEAIDATIIGAYDQLQSTNVYGRDLIAMPEALADNGRATNKSGRLNPEYQNQPNAHIVSLWSTAYFAINQLNLVIDASPSVKMADTKRSAVEGQAYFMRALLYFELMRAYAYTPKSIVAQQDRGGVPLILKGVLELPQVTNASRASIDECYKQIVADFNTAITKLEGTAKSRAPFYVTKGAAQGLLSRVYLYMGDWVNAEKMATDALASGIGVFQTNANYIASWRAAINPESMFEINYQTNENVGVNTSLQTTYTTLVELGNRTKTGGFGDLVPSVNLLAAIESEKDTANKVLDIRRTLYELGTAGRGTAEIECTKFFGKNGAVNLDNVPVIRVSELYLTRAEAIFNQGGREADALKDLNTIRTRAGLPARTSTLTGPALLEEILKQRRIELAFEGHRFFDLKRLGRDIIKVPTNILFTDFRILAPLPVREIQANPNLKQNFGY
jgi:starch-binding outer membrane protein, SusD/RagB family